MRTLLLALAVLAAVLVLAPVAAAADPPVLQTYRRTYTKDAPLSERRKIVDALAADGSPAAREAVLWVLAKQKEMVEVAEKDSDKAAAKVKPLQEEFDVLWRKYCEEVGTPMPETKPVWPIDKPLGAARADLWDAEEKAADERAQRSRIYEAHGQCVDKLPADAQQAYRAALAKGPLVAKDWPQRAEAYLLLKSALAPWVTDLLVGAVKSESDPRALGPAIDGLAGRDPATVVPVIATRIDDPRWIVRAAVLTALEATPSREALDVIVERAQKEEGRLRDDCLRILEALTGAEVAHTPQAWKQWWEANRTAWAGPPAKDPGPDTPEKQRDRDLKAAARRKASRGTGGFFGIQTSSKRLCYVIDVSGSMIQKAVDKGKDTRADLAKAELIRALRGLEDGTLFALVLYASDVRVWKNEMTVASDDTRKAAVAYVEQAVVVGATNTYGALEAAFQLGEPSKNKPTDPYADPKLDTIILLSDGKPTVGRTTKPNEIRAAVRDWNGRRRVTIHAIAFGKDADFDFMRGLATDTGGVYVAP